jgi:hypothetical protein
MRPCARPWKGLADETPTHEPVADGRSVCGPAGDLHCRRIAPRPMVRVRGIMLVGPDFDSDTTSSVRTSNARGEWNRRAVADRGEHPQRVGRSVRRLHLRLRRTLGLGPVKKPSKHGQRPALSSAVPSLPS